MTESRPRQKNKTFAVAPSPFNFLKLELAVVIVLGGLLLVALDSITQDLILQISLSALAGLLGMIWIMWRTHKLLKRFHSPHGDNQTPADGES